VTKAALDPRDRLGAGGGRNASRLSGKELREIGHEKLLDARQTYPTEKGKRPRPDLGDKNRSPDVRSPDVLMVSDLDCHLAWAGRQFERQKKTALPCIRQIRVSGRD